MLPPTLDVPKIAQLIAESILHFDNGELFSFSLLQKDGMIGLQDVLKFEKPITAQAGAPPVM